MWVVQLTGVWARLEGEWKTRRAANPMTSFLFFCLFFLIYSQSNSCWFQLSILILFSLSCSKSSIRAFCYYHCLFLKPSSLLFCPQLTGTDLLSGHGSSCDRRVRFWPNLSVLYMQISVRWHQAGWFLFWVLLIPHSTFYKWWELILGSFWKKGVVLTV